MNDVAQSFNVNNEIETIHGDITQPLTYLTEQYDLLLDNASLYSNEENKIHDALKDYQNIMNKNSYFLMNCFGEKSSGFGTGRQISNNTYSDVKGLFQNRGTVTFFTRERINEIIKELNYEIIYHSNLIENRGDLISEHLITVFKKRTLVR